MKRATIFTATLLVLLAYAPAADAAMRATRAPLRSTPHPITVLVTPIRLFVTVTQAPATFVGKSVSAILRQILIGQGRSPGKTLNGKTVARI